MLKTPSFLVLLCSIFMAFSPLHATPSDKQSFNFSDFFQYFLKKPTEDGAQRDPSLAESEESNAQAYLSSILKDYKYFHATPMQIVGFQIKAVKAYQAEKPYDVIKYCKKIISQNQKDLNAFLLIAASGLIRDYYRDEALSASLLAFHLAQKPKNKALALYFASKLSEKPLSPERQKLLQEYKPEDLQNAFFDIIKSYPNVFLPYDVQTQEKKDSGSVAIFFSKPLKRTKDFRYEDYVSLEPAPSNFAIVPMGDKLSISGLTFGQEYRIILKKGFAGEGGYTLAHDEIIPVAIEHRQPLVEFRERGYILPAKAPQLLPLKSINVPSVKIKVLRLSIPNLLTQINQGNVLDQLYTWELKSLEQTNAELVAEGTFDVGGKADEIVIKGLPIEEVIGKRLQEGVYIIQASKTDYEFAMQWLVISDIGLSTLNGPDGLHITTRSLSTSKPLSNVKVVVLARNGRVLSSRTTNHNGYLHIQQNLLNGKDSQQPALIYAQRHDTDFTFINYTKEGFDFNDRGSEGRSPIKDADCYVYCERGVYRPGDTIKVVGLARDQKGKALKDVPITFKIFRPDFVEVTQMVPSDSGAGAHTFDFQTQPSNHTGSWSIKAYLDPQGESIGETSFLLEDFIPPRIRTDCEIKEKYAKVLDPIRAQVQVDYFYGAPAGDLKVESNLYLIEAKSPFEKWKGYQFGRIEENWTPVTIKIPDQQTNEKGITTLEATVTSPPNTSKVLEAQFKGSVYESTGRPQPFSQKVLFWHQPYAIGIRSLSKNEDNKKNQNIHFDVIAVNEHGDLQEVSELNYTLYREEQTYTWYRSGRDWKYELNIEAYPSEGNLSLLKDKPTILTENFEYGAYRLEVMNPKTGIASSHRFHVGWKGASTTPDRPDMLELTLDKPAYGQGETVQLTVNTPFQGTLRVDAADNETLKNVYHGDIKEKKTVLNLKLDAEMEKKPGIYLLVTAYTGENNAHQKMPWRALGLIWVDLQKDLPKLSASLEAPKVIRPETTIDVNVTVNQPRKKIFMTLAAVDEGLLQLTNFQTPDPFNYFFSQTLFAYRLRDSYGYLIDPFGAKPGTFNVGGGGNLTAEFSEKALASLAERTFKTVSLFSGVVELKTEGNKATAKIPLTFPDFSGEARLMAVIWDDDTTASLSQPILIRDPIESYLNLPRFLAPQDLSTITLDLQNLQEHTEDCLVTIEAIDSVGLKEPFSKKLTLKKDEAVHLPLQIQGQKRGTGTLKLHIQASNNLTISKEWSIDVRSPVFQLTNRKGGTLKPKENLTLDASLFSEFVPETGILDVNIGHIPSFGTKNLVHSLREYPYGCLEQLVSKLTAEFYNEEGEDKTRVKEILSRLGSLQGFDGSFSLWPNYGYFVPWLTLYSIDLLTRFPQKYANHVILQRCFNWLKTYATNSQVQPNRLSEHAYAQYLLAREKLGTLGKLKYFTDLYGKSIKRPSDQAFIAAAFAYYGDTTSANVWFQKATDLHPTDQIEGDVLFFMSNLSNLAIVVSLLAEVSTHDPRVIEMSRVLFDQVHQERYLTTFEKAWILRVSAELSSLQKPVQLSVDGKETLDQKGFQTTYQESELKNKQTITNLSKDPLLYYLSASGEPKDPSKLPNEGFEIDRHLYTLDGTLADLSKIKPGDTFVVILEGKLLAQGSHEVIVLDLVPAGFDIEEANIQRFDIKETLSWLEELSNLSRVEKRDDRYFAITHMDKPGPFKMGYIVRASKPGKYIYPSTVVESMYHPELSSRSPEGLLTIQQ